MTETVDLSFGETFANGFPHAFFRKLRDESPIYWHEATQYSPGGEGFWVVSRYEDCVKVMRDPETFSSTLPTILSTNACAAWSARASRHAPSPIWRRICAGAQN